MSVIELEEEIAKLSQEELSQLTAWLEEFRADQWDRQIEEDIKAGKFDKLARQADEDFEAGRCSPL